MHDLREFLERSTPDALRRRIRRGELGMSHFQVGQLPKQLVVLGVRNARVVENVVAVVVRFYLPAKLLRARADPFTDCHQENSRSASAPPGEMPRASIAPC